MTTSRMFTAALMLFSTLFTLATALPAGTANADLITRQEADTGHVSVFTAGPKLQAMLAAFANGTAPSNDGLEKRDDGETCCQWPSSPVEGGDVGQLFVDILGINEQWWFSYGSCVQHSRVSVKSTLCGIDNGGSPYVSSQDWAQWYSSILVGCYSDGKNQVGTYTHLGQVVVTMEHS